MQQLIEETQKREFFYALYSRIFMKEVDGELLDLLEREEIKEFFPNLYEWDKYQSLERNKLAERYLNVDFAEISVINLVPYESFYVREDGMIESGGDNPVYKYYEEFDFVVEKDKARVVSPDHIGVELEFMYKLTEAQRKALEEGEKDAADELKKLQIGFLSDHILKWVPLYLINVKNEAQTPLYHDAAMTGMEFILSDYQYLNG